ncbi:MAG: hypothetical protein ACYTBJ_20255 [Planctomycetota bacterium]|jgi:hypothetical protein
MTKEEALEELDTLFHNQCGCSGADALSIAIRAIKRLPEDHEDFNNVDCKFCGVPTPAKTAHLHQGEFVGDDCCWDERLRVTE